MGQFRCIKSNKVELVKWSPIFFLRCLKIAVRKFLVLWKTQTFILTEKFSTFICMNTGKGNNKEFSKYEGG